MARNQINSRLLGHEALPSKPLNSIALSDADTSSALSFLKQRMNEASIDVAFSQKESELVERLGGRASDLESVSQCSHSTHFYPKMTKHQSNR